MPPVPGVITTGVATATTRRLQSIQRHLTTSGNIGNRGISTASGNNKKKMVSQKKHKVAIVGSGNW